MRQNEPQVKNFRFRLKEAGKKDHFIMKNSHVCAHGSGIERKRIDLRMER